MPLDDALRDAMVAARTAMLEAQTEAERAQVRFHHAVREVHAAGGSLREIAAVLDMSHQRVHQIVDPDSGKGALRDSPERSDLRTCSFCGRSQGEVAKLIAGPSVYICDACIELATRASATKSECEDSRTVIVPVDDRKATCSFCGKERRRVETMVTGRGTRICSECLALCSEIIDEEIP
jgi:hypothetical protein